MTRRGLLQEDGGWAGAGLVTSVGVAGVAAAGERM